MCHFGFVDLAKTRGYRIALGIQLSEKSSMTSLGLYRRRILGLDVELRGRAGRRRRWRSTGSGRRGSWCGIERFENSGSGFALGVPGDSVSMVLLDILGKIAEDLVEGIEPLDLLRVPKGH